MDSKEIAVYQAVMQLRGQVASAHIRAQAMFASMAIRGVFILNGVVGIGAFASTNRLAMLCCALGAIFAIASAYFAYRTQETLMSLDLSALRANLDSRLHFVGYLNNLHVRYRLRSMPLNRFMTTALCCASLLSFLGGLFATLL